MLVKKQKTKILRFATWFVSYLSIYLSIYLFFSFLSIYKGALKSSYDDVISAMDDLFFLPMALKHWNTNGRIVWTVKETILRYDSYLVTFHENILVSLLTFQPNLKSINQYFEYF